MKVILRYLALGLEVWLGVSGILMGTYWLLSIVESGTDTALPGFQHFAGLLLMVVGALLVADAVRRELKVQLVRKMEQLGNPLDSPTQAG